MVLIDCKYKDRCKTYTTVHIMESTIMKIAVFGTNENVVGSSL